MALDKYTGIFAALVILATNLIVMTTANCGYRKNFNKTGTLHPESSVNRANVLFKLSSCDDHIISDGIVGCHWYCNEEEQCVAFAFTGNNCQICLENNGFETPVDERVPTPDRQHFFVWIDHLLILPEITGLCAEAPCQHGGECILSADEQSYTCLCAGGYTGVNCTEFNECYSNPCVNGGWCIEGQSQYTCQCEPGFEGTNCQMNTDECVSGPCLNGGTCVDAVNQYSCQCTGGFEGTHCETNIDECASGPCLNGGMCVDAVNQYSCQCTGGFGGTRCENVDECFSNPCVNGGTCTDGSNQFTCQCEPGYEGTNCEIDIDECETHVCQNGGTCVDGVNSATCDCPPNFTLDDCSIQYHAQFGTSYYIIVGTDFWTNAIDTCRSHSTHLPEIGSQEENDFIHQFIIALRDRYGLENLAMWMGGTYMNGDFVWNTNNQEFDEYSNWASDEPANSQDGYCMYINDASDQWRSASCTEVLPYICELHYDG